MSAGSATATTNPVRKQRTIVFRIMRILLLVIVGVYLLMVGAIWYEQANIIFHPVRIVDLTPGDLGVQFERVTLPLGSDRLAGWWVPSKDSQAKTLLYLHGNGGNMAANAEHVVRLYGTGLNVFIFDYRGYGDSTGGPPHEKLVYEDAARAWKYLVDERKIPPGDIVIYGHSLGGAVAIDLAARHPEAGALVTESTFTSVADVGTASGLYAYFPIRLILTERFDSISKIKSIRMPKLFLHGQKDSIIPPQMAQQLYDAAPEPRQLLYLPGGHHEDSAVVDGTRYFAALNAFLQQYHFETTAADLSGLRKTQ